VPACNGLGSKYDFDPHASSSIGRAPIRRRPRSRFCSALLKRTIELGAYAHGFDLNIPFEKQPPRAEPDPLWLASLHGRAASATITDAEGKKIRAEKGFRFHGILKFLDRNFQESNSDSYREWMTQYMSATLCSVCHGKRLRPSPWP